MQTANRPPKPVLRAPPTKLLYLSSVPKNINCFLTREVFSQFGRIEYIELNLPNLDSRKSASNGFCLIKFKDESAIERLSALRELEIDNRLVKLKLLEARNQVFELQEKLRRCRVYIDYIPGWVTEQQLGYYFSRFGEVERVYTIPWVDKPSRVKRQSLQVYRKEKEGDGKIGYVVYSDPEAIDRIPRDQLVFDNITLNWSSFYNKPGKWDMPKKDPQELEIENFREFGVELLFVDARPSSRQKKVGDLGRKMAKVDNDFFKSFGRLLESDLEAGRRVERLQRGVAGSGYKGASAAPDLMRASREGLEDLERPKNTEKTKTKAVGSKKSKRKRNSSGNTKNNTKNGLTAVETEKMISEYYDEEGRLHINRDLLGRTAAPDTPPTRVDHDLRPTSAAYYQNTGRNQACLSRHVSSSIIAHRR